LLQNLGKNSNSGKKFKFWKKFRFWSKIQILAKNANFEQKFKFWTKIQILVRYENAGQKHNFGQKLDFKNRNREKLFPWKSNFEKKNTKFWWKIQISVATEIYLLLYGPFIRELTKNGVFPYSPKFSKNSKFKKIRSLINGPKIFPKKIFLPKKKSTPHPPPPPLWRHFEKPIREFNSPFIRESESVYKGIRKNKKNNLVRL